MFRVTEAPKLTDNEIVLKLMLLHKEFHKKAHPRNSTVSKQWIAHNKEAAIALYQAARRIQYLQSLELPDEQVS